jgi:hypothetical protein
LFFNTPRQWGMPRCAALNIPDLEPNLSEEHELDGPTAKKVPSKSIGKLLSAKKRKLCSRRSQSDVGQSSASQVIA